TPSPSCLTRREGMHALPLFYFTSSFARQVVYVISSDCLQKTPTRGWRRRVSQRGLKLRRVDPEQVIQRYQELRNLEKTGREFGITRERVRQIVNRAGISTARVIKPKPEKPERLCKECGAAVNSSHALYCETHRKEKHKRR